MNATNRNDEDAPESRSVHVLRLVALLLDLVERLGKARAAAILGVNCHAATPAPDAQSAEPSSRVRRRSASEPPLREQWRWVGADTECCDAGVEAGYRVSVW